MGRGVDMLYLLWIYLIGNCVFGIWYVNRANGILPLEGGRSDLLWIRPPARPGGS